MHITDYESVWPSLAEKKKLFYLDSFMGKMKNEEKEIKKSWKKIYKTMDGDDSFPSLQLDFFLFQCFSFSFFCFKYFGVRMCGVGVD